MSTNASGSKAGYNYQDVVAVGCLVYFIKRLDAINDEGQEDISLKFTDKHIDLIQAKETKHIFKKHAPYLKEALGELITQTKKFLKIKYPKYLIYMTNSHYPLGKHTEYEFPLNNFGFTAYNYKQLNKSTQKDIQKKITASSKIKRRSGKSLKYPYISQLQSNHPIRFKNILKRLTFSKLNYEGMGETKLLPIYTYIRQFLREAQIPQYLYRNVFNDLYTTVTRSSEQQDKDINKERFMSEIFITVFRPNKSKLSKFFTFCKINFTKNYIKEEQSNISSMFLHQYNYSFPISHMFNKYLKERKNPYENEYKLLGEFINTHVFKLSKIINEKILNKYQIHQIKKDYKNNKYKIKKIIIHNDKLIEIVKYISWITILNNQEINNIKEASNYDNTEP